MKRKSLVTFGLSAILLLLCPVASMGDSGKTRNYIRMEETRIMGVIEHPEVTYIIPKTVIRFSHIRLERSFREPGARHIDPQQIHDEILLRNIFSGAGAHQEE